MRIPDSLLRKLQKFEVQMCAFIIMRASMTCLLIILSNLYKKKHIYKFQP